MVTRCAGFSALLILLIAAPAAGNSSEPQYFQDLSPDTYLPGRHVVLTVAKPPAPLARVYAVPPARAVEYFRTAPWDPGVLDGLSQVAGGQFRALPGGRTQSFDAGPLPVGYYAVAIGDGKSQERWMFSVSSFGLANAVSGDTEIFWAIDLQTFDRTRAPVTMWAYMGQARRRLSVNSDGVAIDPAANGRDGGHVVASVPDGSYQIADEFELSRYRGDGSLISTDRPIYRPGQTVYIRAILRGGGAGAYEIPRGQIHLKVTSLEESRIIAERPLHVSPFGTASTSVRLADDAATGQYEIDAGQGRPIGYFNVVAYKKPEFTLRLSSDHSWTVAGDPTAVRMSANYLFGRPAGGLRLHYDAFVLGSYYADGTAWVPAYDSLLGGGPGARYADLAAGDTITNAAGQFDLTFTASAVDRAQPIVILARANDASGRTVSTQLSLLDRPAAFDISIEPARWFVAAGETDRVDIRTRDDDGAIRQNQPLTVTIERLQWNQSDRRYETVDRETQTRTTDAAGLTTLPWTPATAGTYKIVVQGSDDRARVATESVFTVAEGAESAGDRALPAGQIRLVPETTTLAPGEHARILVMASEPNRDALVAVCTDRFVRLHVMHVAGTAATIDEAPPPGAAKFTISVFQGDAEGGSSGHAMFAIDPPPHRLTVHIAPSRSRYRPGDAARLRIEVRDSAGKPVRAEIGLGVVDEAIFALQQRRQDPFEAFYGYATELFVRGGWNMAGAPYVHGLRTIANVMARAAVPPPATGATSDSDVAHVRQNFLDTAFWAPSVVTDARGQAVVSFHWPDDLTTWRATGTAVTMATDIGTGTADALVTKDFLVRLEMPRFLRVGDRSTFTGIAQGVAARPAVTLRLDAKALAPRAAVQPAALDANATASAAWPTYAAGIGAFPVTLYGSDGVLRDAMQTALPVEGATPEEHVIASGSGSGSARMAVPPGYGAGSVTVTLSPSAIAELLQSLRLLQVYPYDCTEQTLSAALPALFVGRTLRRLDASDAFDLKPRAIIFKALDRLRELRHSDGSYGWWEHDAAHPFMTAYALYAMAEFKRAGYFVDDEMTIDSLIDQLQASNDDTLRFWGGRQPGSEWNTRAFMLFALADAAPKRVDPAMLREARTRASSMNAYAVAVLGLAEHFVGDDESARELLRMLDARVADNGAEAYWPGQTWDYAWEDDPIETTAYALRLQAALDPESPLVGRVKAFLRGQMRGGWAYTTKDTAATIYALSEASTPDPNELHPDETVRVTLDGRTIRSVRVQRPVLDSAEAEIVIPAGEIRDGSLVGVVRSGSGALYWSADLTRYVPAPARTAVDRNTPLLERLFPPRPDVTIARRYLPERPGPWRVGERIAVEITVTSRRDLQYVAIDDPFPAGAEHPIDEGMAGAYAWSGLQFLDDRATFFADRLTGGKPLVLRYSLDLTAAGTYTAPATMVSSMYGPPVKALGEPETVTILAQ